MGRRHARLRSWSSLMPLDVLPQSVRRVQRALSSSMLTLLRSREEEERIRPPYLSMLDLERGYFHFAQISWTTCVIPCNTGTPSSVAIRVLIRLDNTWNGDRSKENRNGNPMADQPRLASRFGR